MRFLASQRTATTTLLWSSQTPLTPADAGNVLTRPADESRRRLLPSPRSSSSSPSLRMASYDSPTPSYHSSHFDRSADDNAGVNMESTATDGGPMASPTNTLIALASVAITDHRLVNANDGEVDESTDSMASRPMIALPSFPQSSGLPSLSSWDSKPYPLEPSLRNAGTSEPDQIQTRAFSIEKERRLPCLYQSASMISYPTCNDEVAREVRYVQDSALCFLFSFF